jgi:glyoxylase-like metal-dependent hydrolase (beta-lactamase superfamily II)
MRSPLVVLLLLSCGLPFVPARVFVTPRPPAVPIEVCWLETGGRDAAGGLGASGVARADQWHVTTSALLVRHPRGDLLIDAGLGEREATGQGLTGWRRFVFDRTAGSNEPRGSLGELLDALHARPLAVIASHAHADHLGGLLQLPGVPAWLAQEELDFVNRPDSPVAPALVHALQGRMEPIAFTSGAYALFERSHDVFGDGTVVVVPTPGHTPGSVSTFVSLGDRRFVHVGDLVNLQESIERGATKSAVMRWLTDDDAAKTDAQVATLVALHQLDPTLWVLPAHDRVAWEALFGPTPIGSPPRCVRSGP